MTYLMPWPRLHQRQWVLPKTSEDHRIIQIGRHLRRAVAQRPAERRATYEVRLGYLGLSPVGSWKPPMLETPQPFWAASSTSQFFLGSSLQFTKFFLVSSHNLSCFNVHCLSTFRHALWRGVWLCLLDNLLLSISWLLLNVFNKFLHPYWKRNKIQWNNSISM